MDGAFPYHIFLGEIKRNNADNARSFSAFLTEMLCTWLDIVDPLRQKGNPVRSAGGKLQAIPTYTDNIRQCAGYNVL